jgi:hypothetical protein
VLATAETWGPKQCAEVVAVIAGKPHDAPVSH